MRKSFDGLTGIVVNEFGREINTKDVFIFLNKELTHVKVLLYESDGFTLFYRRLHKGRFTVPAATSVSGTINCRSQTCKIEDLRKRFHKLTLKYLWEQLLCAMKCQVLCAQTLEDIDSKKHQIRLASG